MGRARLEVTRASAEEIYNLIRKDEKYMVGVKLFAIYQIARGAVSRDLEQMYKISFKSVCNWVHKFNEKGLEGLKEEHRSGRKPRLSDEEMSRIKKTILKETPKDYGYNTTTWTGPILNDHIEKQYGVKYKKAQIYNIMKKMGLSYQKGKGIYPEANAEKREGFIKELKKTKK